MADDADLAQEREERIAALTPAPRFDLPQGTPGDCDTCGNWSGRLIEGDCAPCREKRARCSGMNGGW